MKLVGKAILYGAFILLAVMSLQRVGTESARQSARAKLLASMDEPRDRDPAPGEDSAITNVVAGVETNTATNGTNGFSPGATTNRAKVAASGRARPAPTGMAGERGSALGFWIAAFVVGVLGLAGLVGWDITQWFAIRTNRALGVEVKVPEEKAEEYETAEQEWAKGNHLDAITLMREYLALNPSEQYVALRIAEIYEKDLGNYLAAALEYEEVLNKKLPREKWGWTALRLSNLYSGRLNQPDQAIATLERVIRDYPETAAAKKARERLGVPEPTEEPVGEMDVGPVGPSPEATPAEATDASTLPSGFRRKK